MSFCRNEKNGPNKQILPVVSPEHKLPFTQKCMFGHCDCVLNLAHMHTNCVQFQMFEWHLNNCVLAVFTQSITRCRWFFLLAIEQIQYVTFANMYIPSSIHVGHKTSVKLHCKFALILFQRGPARLSTPFNSSGQVVTHAASSENIWLHLWTRHSIAKAFGGQHPLKESH